MKRALMVVSGCLFMLSGLLGNEYSDTFPSTGPELTWTSAYDDTLGNPLTEMDVTTFNSPSGDNSVGIVVADTAYIGGMGLVYGGSEGLTDYSVEANVYVLLDSAYYQGIMSRFVITDTTAECYQLVANFSGPPYPGMPAPAKVRFRHWDQSAAITILGEWAAADLPGGAPTQDGWHKLKLVAKGNEFWCYWDDQLLGDGPVTDTTDAPISSGYFGAYIWDAFTATPQSIMVDDFLVELRTDWADTFPIAGPELAWTSAYDDTLDNPLTEMGVTTFNSPSGDNSVGIVVTDTAYIGGMGLVYGGSDGLTDYSVEANVYVLLDSAYYQGIVSRLMITDTTAECYQLVANFSGPPYPGMPAPAKVRFRHWDQSAAITILGEWAAADLPGGAPTQDGWHKLKLVAKGNEFWCYWDDQLLGDGPVTDTTDAPISSGYFGAYIWDAFTATPQSIMVDDFIVAEFIGPPVSISESSETLPTGFTLAQNYPNPFNPSTTIEFQILVGGEATLDVYNINGRLIRTLFKGYLLPSSYWVIWDGRDQSSRLVPSGIYVYRLTSGTRRESKRMVLLK